MLFEVMLGLALAGSPRAVSPRMAGNAEAPVWSPDGTRLAWQLNAHACKRVQLLVFDERAGRLATVAPAASGGATATALDPRRPPDPCSSGGSGALAGFSTGAAGGAAQGLTWDTTAAAGFGRFAFAGATRQGDLDLYAFDGMAGGAVVVSPGADGDPAWLPGAQAVVFTSARSGDGDLYRIDLDSGDLTRLTSRAGAAEIAPAVHPNGRAVAFVSHDDTGDHVWVLDAVDGSATPRRLTAQAGLQLAPVWSPSGDRVAYFATAPATSPGAKERFDLWVVGADGTGARALLEGVVPSPRGPAWSPDGSTIVVVQADDARFNPVVAVSAAGGAPRPLNTGTVGNRDLSLVRGLDGKLWLAVAAVGREGDEVRDYRRIYVVEVRL